MAYLFTALSLIPQISTKIHRLHLSILFTLLFSVVLLWFSTITICHQRQPSLCRFDCFFFLSVSNLLLLNLQFSWKSSSSFGRRIYNFLTLSHSPPPPPATLPNKNNNKSWESRSKRADCVDCSPSSLSSVVQKKTPEKKGYTSNKEETS